MTSRLNEFHKANVYPKCYEQEKLMHCIQRRVHLRFQTQMSISCFLISNKWKLNIIVKQKYFQLCILSQLNDQCTKPIPGLSRVCKRRFERHWILRMKISRREGL